MNKRIVQIIIHLAAWACFITLPFVFYPRPRDFSFFTEKYFSQFFIISNILLIGFYYLNTNVLIPRLLEQRKLVGYIGIILALLIIYGCIPRIYHYVTSGHDGHFFSHRGGGNGSRLNPGQANGAGSGAGQLNGGQTNAGAPGGGQDSTGLSNVDSSVTGTSGAGPSGVGAANSGQAGSASANGVSGNLSNSPDRPGRIRDFRPPLLSAGAISIFLLVFVFSTGVKVINQWLHSEQRNKEIANEKLNAELSFLKAQINPHFLFNTLNNIYSLASSNSDQTAPAIMKLSSIMRYVLTEAKNDHSTLEKEIQFISHYIELQKMRLTDKSSVRFTIHGDTENKHIAPLLFLPFVENAFKYGISTRESSPIDILLEITGNLIYFKVVNAKHIHTTLKTVDKTGIGINNTRRRLDLLYPGKHTLTIDDEASSFTVNLKIQL